MQTNKDKNVYLITESLFQGFMRNAINILMALFLIGIGVYLKSSAMQWLGFVFSVISIFAMSKGLRNKYEKTPQQAADWLHEKYGVIAND